FIEQNYGRSPRRCFRNGLREQFCDRALCLAHRRTGQRMRLDFNELKPCACERLGGPMCRAAGERGLASAWWADEENHAMQRHDAAIHLAPKREVEHRLGQELRLNLLFDNDRVPKRSKAGIGERADPVYSLREANLLM